VLIQSRVLIAALIISLWFVAVPARAESGWNYGKRGLEWSNTETGSYFWLGLRGQARYTSTEQALRVPSEYRDPSGSDYSMNRGRYKIGAAYQDSVSFYHEYDLVNTRVLDLRATWIEHPQFNLRLGQWKAEYNRARFDSSGKQQFVERSIATYWFTLDRQRGVMASGRVGQGTGHDSSWWLGILAGEGLNTDASGGRPMVMGRWQWNYTGNLLPFSQSALKRYTQPRASLAFAMVTNESPYTRFSSDGGGQLPGYSLGTDGQYRVWQAMQEWAWQKEGLSFQQELHFKSIDDRASGGTQNLFGGYAQTGWFPSDRWPQVSDKLEVALRGAYVDSDSEDNLESLEFTVGENWFFNGHRNKLTTDVSYVEAQDDSEKGSEYRFQVQWDLSI
jgi:phosphate-selective porin OprO/OprP